MKLDSKGCVFKIFQSVTKDGPHKWYWSLEQPNGHIYHISEGYYEFKICVEDLDVHGPVILQQLHNGY